MRAARRGAWRRRWGLCTQARDGGEDDARCRFGRQIRSSSKGGRAVAPEGEAAAEETLRSQG